MTKSRLQQRFVSIGIDVGKEVFHLVGFSDDGKIALRKKIRRSAFTEISPAAESACFGRRRYRARNGERDERDIQRKPCCSADTLR